MVGLQNGGNVGIITAEEPERDIDAMTCPYAYLVAHLYPELWIRFLNACNEEKKKCQQYTESKEA